MHAVTYCKLPCAGVFLRMWKQLTSVCAWPCSCPLLLFCHSFASDDWAVTEDVPLKGSRGTVFAQYWECKCSGRKALAPHYPTLETAPRRPLFFTATTAVMKLALSMLSVWCWFTSPDFKQKAVARISGQGIGKRWTSSKLWSVIVSALLQASIQLYANRWGIPRRVGISTSPS